MNKVIISLVLVSVFASNTVMAKAKYRKPSSENAVKCSISTEKQGEYVGYFVLINNEREDEGVWMNKVSAYEHLASLQNQGICVSDKKIIPVLCKVETEKASGEMTLSYVVVGDAKKEDSGAWSNVKGAEGQMADLQKKGICK